VGIVTVRRSFRVTGVVQGVGFRPFVHVLATSLGLTGLVGNDAEGVFCEVEGATTVVEEFTRRLVDDAPPLARIEEVAHHDVPPTAATGFHIVASAATGGATLISADLAPCPECLAEMGDPADRRYRYPFINCTNCGPRFTITVDIPYDRPNTTMAGFPMCSACLAEYEDPTNRRFHAQPIACPACGPRIWTVPESPDPLRAVRDAVAAGAIVAVKGLGGFHLACRADDDSTLRRLRERKGRVDKPFALMAADLETARALAEIDDAEAALLTGPERPIVLCRRRPRSGLSDQVAPGNGWVGLMLTSTPLHHLLLEGGEAWVMTSGNRSQEPICVDNDEARHRLGGIADMFLLHDRPIHVPCDDSVVRVTEGRLSPVRRSRGYAPYPIPIAFPGPEVLAVGGELKATACLTRGRHAFMSQHIGDMENLETLEAFEAAVRHLETLFRVSPQVVACDLHPRYLSSEWARRSERRVVEVQHHHAHVASLLAEHGTAGPIVGFSFDGTGYGTDGTAWGGEVLVADLSGFDRVGHLRPSALAGGDTAVRRPYRQALARLAEAGIGWSERLAPVRAAGAEERRVLSAQLERGLNTVATTSMGRLFDAVAALAGLRQVVTYEGQAAIELEALADLATGAYRIEVGDGGVWDTTALVAAVAADALSGEPVGVISGRFHRGVALAIGEAAGAAREAHGLEVVGLTGGVFQNVVLTRLAGDELRRRGFRVLLHRLVPPNDGGLALGQAAVAATCG
jgi:hydrogenase maturation protein HypF